MGAVIERFETPVTANGTVFRGGDNSFAADFGFDWSGDRPARAGCKKLASTGVPSRISGGGRYARRKDCRCSPSGGLSKPQQDSNASYPITLSMQISCTGFVILVSPTKRPAVVQRFSLAACLFGYRWDHRLKPARPISIR